MKKRVLLVASGGLDKSGVPTVIMTIVRALREDYNFDILLGTREEGYFEPEFRQYGGRIFRRPKRRFHFAPLNTLADFFRPAAMFVFTRRLIRRYGPYDVVHCHNEFDMAGSLAAAASGGIPVRVGHVHKTWSQGGGPLTRLYRGVCRRLIHTCATARLACSRQAGKAFYSAQDDFQAVENPYDELRFRPDPDGSVGDGGIRVIQVGYFCDNKNQRFTLEVFRALAAARPDARLTFVGAADTPYGEALRAAIRETRLEDRISLLPADAEIPVLLNQSTLMLLPSKAEGFGMALVEAQAVGLPCYASDAVPREANLGGVRFLALADGPGAWAKTILDEQRFTQKIRCDCSAFTTGRFAEAIRVAYRCLKPHGRSAMPE